MPSAPAPVPRFPSALELPSLELPPWFVGPVAGVPAFELPVLDLSFPGVEFPEAPVFPFFTEPASVPDLSLPVAEDPD